MGEIETDEEPLNANIQDWIAFCFECQLKIGEKGNWKHARAEAKRHTKLLNYQGHNVRVSRSK